MTTSKNLDLNIEIDVLTPGSAAEVVNAVLEFLLYQRNQIPFVYKTYKYYVAKWLEESSSKDKRMEDREGGGYSDDESLASVPNFHLERQRDRATQTKQSISAMRELINEAFEKNEIKCLRFLLGSTTCTPLESYTIHIPTAAISRKHSYKHHPIQQSHLNQMLINLLTSEDLYNIFSKNIGPTNMFLELEMLDSTHLDKTTTTAHIFPKDFRELPARCANVHLNLVLSKPITTCESVYLQCCKELHVYKDFITLSLADVFKKNSDKLDSVTPAWWEAEIFVRGFKEKPIKSGNIWTI